jgi:hypothetical protein
MWAALLAIAPFVSVLTGRAEFYFDDHFRFSTPVTALVAESLRAGHLPLWNPWVQTGIPFIADRGTLVCHPGMLLALVMSPSHAIGTLMVLMLGVLAAGSTALLRALSVRPMLAIGVGAAIGLSGPALSYTSNAVYLATLAFWPLVLLSAVRIATGRGSAIAGGAALGMALLGGDVPGALIAAVVALFAFFGAGGRLRVAWPRLVGMYSIGLVLGTVSWYPLLWALVVSDRGAGIVAAEAGHWSFHPGEIVGFLWPHPLGLPLPRFTFWPFFRHHEDRLFLHSVWMGLLPAMASVLSLRKGADRVARNFTIIALALLVVATGNTTPLWLILRPIFTFVRYPSKTAAYAALLLGLSGAVAINSLLSHPRKLRLLCSVAVVVAAMGGLVGPAVQAALARRAGAPSDIIGAAASAFRTDNLRVALIALVAAVVFLLVERGRLSALRAIPTLATLLFLDVFVTTEAVAWTRPTSVPARPSYLPDADLRGPRVMRLKEVARARLPSNDIGFSQEQMRQASLLSPLSNLLWHVGVLDPYGYYYAELTQSMSELATTAPVALAEVIAADVILAAPNASAPWLLAAIDSHRLRPTHSLAAGAIVLRVQHPMPRSFLTSSASLGSRTSIPGQLGKSIDRVWLASERALLSGRYVTLDPSVVPPQLIDAPSQPPLALAPTNWRPGAATYQTNLPAPSLLVDMDAFAPGWRVFVDGREQPILQANAFGRAVVVPAGSHTISWTFAPALVIASVAISWVGLALVLLALLAGRRAVGGGLGCGGPARSSNAQEAAVCSRVQGRWAVGCPLSAWHRRP